MECVQAQNIPLSQVLLIDNLLEADSNTFLSSFPVLDDPKLISEVETAHEQADEITKGVDKYFSEL